MGFGLVYFGRGMLAASEGNLPILEHDGNGDFTLGFAYYFSWSSFVLGALGGLSAVYWTAQLTAALELLTGIAFLIVVVAVSVTMLINEDPFALAKRRPTIGDVQRNLVILQNRTQQISEERIGIDSEMKVSEVLKQYLSWGKTYHDK